MLIRVEDEGIATIWDTRLGGNMLGRKLDPGKETASVIGGKHKPKLLVVQIPSMLSVS
jgi:hypothetical protein